MQSLNSRQDLVGKKVLVAMTGRGDSALAAFLLKKQGMEVLGITFVTLNDELLDEEATPVCHVRDLDRVKAVCDFLHIPFYASNLKSEYETLVIDSLVAHRIVGEANSSCFDCTQLRLTVLREKMSQLGADYIATGHFAKIRLNYGAKSFEISSANDPDSDQSFLLAGIDERVKERLILPLGEISKAEAQKYISHFKIPVAKSSEQKYFCFRSLEMIKKMIAGKAPKSLVSSGPVQNIESEQNYGEHEGMAYHYIGEKQLNFKEIMHIDKNLEIVDYSPSKKTIYLGREQRLSATKVQIVSFNSVNISSYARPISCFAKYKYSNQLIPCELFFKNNQTVIVEFQKPVYPIIRSEIFVFYSGSSQSRTVIAWGKVGSFGDFEPINRVREYEIGQDDEESKSTEAKKNKFYTF